MYRWSRFPFLRIVLFYGLGLLLARNFGISSETTTLIFIAIVVAWLLTIALPSNKFGILKGWLLLGGFVALGVLNYNFRLTPDDTTGERKWDAYTGVIQSYPIHKGKYYQYEVQVQQRMADSAVNTSNHKIKLYVLDSGMRQSPYRYGDLLAVRSSPFRIPGPKNPHEFDYARYMRDQGILHQDFCSTEDIMIVDRDRGNNLLSAVYRVRKYFHEILEDNIPGDQERAVASALLLGKKDELDQETKEAFATAGAMHVLAVSGLHVGVIYLLFGWVFRRINSRFVKTYVEPAVVILALWFYALLTGFSPSIFRAVVMFSVIIFGKSLNRQVNIYNSIAVSAFILLVSNPMNLFSVGFQLSYLAVIGIVFIYDELYPLVRSQYWIIDKIWMLTCISLAAQLATAPISIYYFNQFPTYFLFSNLIVIPVAFLIMYGGVLLLILGKLGIALWIGKGVELLIWLLNTTVIKIDALPYSRWEWIYLSEWQVLLVYAAIIFFLLFLMHQKRQLIWYGIAMTLLFAANRSIAIIQQSISGEIIFYSTRENLLIDDIHGLQSDLISLDSIENRELAAYQLHPNRIANYLDPIGESKVLKDLKRPLSTFASLDVRNDQRFLYLYGDIPDTHDFQLETDYLILTGNHRNSSESVLEHFKFNNLILSNDTKFYSTLEWKEICQRRQLPLNALRDKAFVIKN